MTAAPAALHRCSPPRPPLIESVSLTLNGTNLTFTQLSGAAIPVGEDRWLPGRPQGLDAGQVANALADPSWRHGQEPFTFRVLYRGVGEREAQQLQLDVGTIGSSGALRVRRVTHAAPAASR